MRHERTDGVTRVINGSQRGDGEEGRRKDGVEKEQEHTGPDGEVKVLVLRAKMAELKRIGWETGKIEKGMGCLFIAEERLRGGWSGLTEVDRLPVRGAEEVNLEQRGVS